MIKPFVSVFSTPFTINFPLFVGMLIVVSSSPFEHDEKRIIEINKVKNKFSFFIIVVSFDVFFWLNFGNVLQLGEVANFGNDYFLSRIKFLVKDKRKFTTKFAILPNACL